MKDISVGSPLATILAARKASVIVMTPDIIIIIKSELICMTISPPICEENWAS